MVTWLEAAGGHDNDVGSEDGVDQFIYHFDRRTRLRFSLDQFDDTPELVILNASGREVAHLTAAFGEVTIGVRGEHTVRLVHPRAGDASAQAIVVFLQAEAEGAPTPNPNDVATLKAGKNCPGCNLAGLSWNACPNGTSLAGVDLSHADFTAANLACLTFQPNGTTPVLLTGAIFEYASLNQVTLRGVDLTDAQLSGATFEITLFDGVTATGADFSSSQWPNSTFGAMNATGS